MKKLFILIGFFIISNFNNAQSKSDSIISIVERYDNLIEESSSYKKYKVIEKNKVKAFRKEIVASKDSLENIIAQQKAKQDKLNDNIDELETDLNNTQASLGKIKQKNDSISFLGMQMQKTTYRIISWSVIAVLVSISILLFINYRKSNIVTQATKESMSNLEVEYQEYRRNAIEKQQQQGRQILDLQKSVKKKQTGTGTGNAKNNT